MIDSIDSNLICSVTDNGNGLSKSHHKSGNHLSYSGKGISERIRVYNSIRKNKSSFQLKDNNPGVTATLIVPLIFNKKEITV